jgi:hypothetical protein
MKESLDVADKLLSALEKGPVRAIGGIVFDAEMKPLMNTTDMHKAVRALETQNILVRRQDAGGSPTWNIESQAAKLVAKLLA